ncbi:MAG: AbrB/MazE/SpoVT family DNA-binding domain-containing protein [Rhodospirillaceae bacterium]|nr:AbrB/MazE/SpoVT family DNA-binding domain-containing protein [Rhodospirillaceae bacterium]
MATTVTTKGQVTIPKRVREHLGIVPGSAVEFDLNKDGQIVLLKAKGKGPGKVGGKAGGKKPPLSRFAQVRGSATVKMTTEEIMRMWRGDDWRGDD